MGVWVGRCRGGWVGVRGVGVRVGRCKGGWVDGGMGGWMEGWVDGGMGGWMEGWVGGWRGGWVDGGVGGWRGGCVGVWGSCTRVRPYASAAAAASAYGGIPDRGGLPRLVMTSSPPLGQSDHSI